MVTGFLEGLHTPYVITVFIVGLIPRHVLSVWRRNVSGIYVKLNTSHTYIQYSPLGLNAKM